MRTLTDQHHSRHNSTETRIYTGQVFFLSRARGPRLISGILAGQQHHTNVNSSRGARLWWAAHCAWPSHFTEGLSASPKGVHCTTQVDTSLCGSTMGSYASSAGTARRPLFTPATPINFFFSLLWGKKGPLSGKNTQALITQRGTGVGGAPHHHSPPPPDLCKTVSFSPGAMALWEGRHSCHTNTANTDTAAHALLPPETGAHSRISYPKASFLQLFLLDATMREKKTAELSPAMASLHVWKSSIWKCSIHILSGGASPSKHI